jgi:hypothetical protein
MNKILRKINNKNAMVTMKPTVSTSRMEKNFFFFRRYIQSIFRSLLPLMEASKKNLSSLKVFLKL